MYFSSSVRIVVFQQFLMITRPVYLERLEKQLDVAGARILGVALNKVDLDGNGYYGHKYYGKYYGNYGEDNQSTGSYRRITNYSATDTRKKAAHTSFRCTYRTGGRRLAGYQIQYRQAGKCVRRTAQRRH